MTSPTVRARHAARSAAAQPRAPWHVLTHGLLADAIIPPSLERYENPAEFRALLRTLCDELAPEGVVEGMMVEGVASCTWRLGRVHRALGGAISQANERAGAENEKRARLIATVRTDRAAIEQALAAGDLEGLQRVLDPQGLYLSCEGQGALAMAADQLRRIQDDLSEEEIKDPQTACDRAAMPDLDEALDLARYESHLERELRRDLATLRQLQRERRRAPRHRPARGQPTAPGEPPDPVPSLPAGATVGGHPAPAGGQSPAPAASPHSAPSLPAGATVGGHLPPQSKAGKRKSVKRTHPQTPPRPRRRRFRLQPPRAAPEDG